MNTKPYYITLAMVPLVSNPTYPLDFRPIASCNGLYKCITEPLCMRLKSCPALLSYRKEILARCMTKGELGERKTKKKTLMT